MESKTSRNGTKTSKGISFPIWKAFQNSRNDKYRNSGGNHDIYMADK